MIFYIKCVRPSKTKYGPGMLQKVGDAYGSNIFQVCRNFHDRSGQYRGLQLIATGRSSYRVFKTGCLVIYF